MIKFMHGLGPRYHANFQDKALVRFLTYEVSTSLNMHLLSSASGEDSSSLRKMISDGPLFNENCILVKVVPELVATASSGSISSSASQQDSRPAMCIMGGGVCAAMSQPFDVVLWKIGGARLTLHLVQLAQASETFVTIFSFSSYVASSRRNTSYPEPLPSFATASAIAGRTRKIWKEYVRLC